jgi:pimeloyl-ACP methyl ester carboxylesterase
MGAAHDRQFEVKRFPTGAQMAEIMRLVAGDVTPGVIADSGHWVMEEQPEQTTAAIVKFIVAE